MAIALVQVVLSAASAAIGVGTIAVEAGCGARAAGGTPTVAGAVAGAATLGTRLHSAPTRRMQSMH